MGMKNAIQVDILKQIFSNMGEEDKQSFLDWVGSLSKVKSSTIVSPVSSIESFLVEHKSHTCPHCGSSHVSKNGH